MQQNALLPVSGLKSRPKQKSGKSSTEITLRLHGVTFQKILLFLFKRNGIRFLKNSMSAHGPLVDNYTTLLSLVVLYVIYTAQKYLL
jgi:hypothetical protein